MACNVTAPWYCICNGSYFEQLLGCPTGVLTQAEQVATMKSNFGGSSDPTLVDQAVSDFNNYLTTTGYQATVNNLQCQDSLLGCSPFGNIPWSTLGLVAIGVVGLFVVMGDSGARRYGR